MRIMVFDNYQRCSLPLGGTRSGSLSHESRIISDVTLGQGVCGFSSLELVENGCESMVHLHTSCVRQVLISHIGDIPSAGFYWGRQTLAIGLN